MNPLYAYSLMPVLAISLLLSFTLVLRVKRHWGLAAYCGATFVWSSTLLASTLPSWAELGSRGAAVGAFIAATYIHAAFEFTSALRRGFVVLAYAVATTLTVVGFFVPGVLYNPATLAAGPFFWPGMTLAVIAAVVPLYALVVEIRRASDSQRRPLGLFLIAGLVGYAGAWSNALMLSNGIALPYGMLAVLASLLMLGAVVQSVMEPSDRKLMERSLAYSAVTAFVSAGFLVGVYWVIEDQAMVRGFRIGALFLVFLAAWAFDPLRQLVLEFLGARIEPERAHASQLARELVRQEERTAHAERLAELGQFTSAIAHEIRNPLGVLSAHLKLLERNPNVSEVTVEEMRGQIDRASHFVDDLLAYGRPTPLELRQVKLKVLIELGASTARQALQRELHLELVGDELPVEADQSQLLQVFVILFENALFAGATRVDVRWIVEDDSVSIDVTDDGPGVSEAVADRLFEPFVTSRKRDHEKPGTGLGLAIARGIMERHHGGIEHVTSDSGARFSIWLPVRQPLIAAAD